MNYDQRMTEKYVDKIKNGELCIDLESQFYGQVNKQVYGLQFLQNLNIQTLFLNRFNIKTLLMYNCENIIPKIHCNTITKLILSNVHLKNWNLYNLQLDNLEQLFLKKQIFFQDNGRQKSDEEQIKTLKMLYGENCCDNASNLLEQNIVKFKKLKELCIEVEVNVNIALIQQMTQLNILTLDCKLSNVDALKYLINLQQLCICSNINMESIPIQHLTQLVVLRLKCGNINVDSLKVFKNLKELDLSGNKNLDITSLQYLHQLIILNLSSCELKKVDSLRYLVNLKKLYLSHNNNLDITPLQYIPQIIILDLSSCELKSIEVLKALVNLKYLSLYRNCIVFIQPLEQLNQLQLLNVQGNKLIDLYKLQNHPNIKLYYYPEDQEYPSQYEIRHANYLKKICVPIDSLKMLKQKKHPITQAKQKVEDLLKKLLCQQVAFVGQVTVLFQQLNTFDNYQ
ncbi:DUF3888_domain-containing protein [Hexamita inflata]|uniref:DUF3888 domain-containing protein n=1 Tax=Hexamita inflata TaxID=28002 RepID=A0AA86R5K3_9EUKA|nr:DUF3888 domain-containing protein [Hexamita inflata]